MNRIKQLRKFDELFCVSGSQLITQEKQCLDLAFDASPIELPQLQQLQRDRRAHLQDHLLPVKGHHFAKKLKELLQELTSRVPVVIVASSTADEFNKVLKVPMPWNYTDLRKKQDVKFMEVVQSEFTLKNSRGHYGVFLISEAQGRGTDFKSTQEIENAGGNCLILGDTFSQRAEDQIKGRVGRLDKKGQWFYFLAEGNERKSVEQLIAAKKEEAKNNLLKKFQHIVSELQNSSFLESEDEEEEDDEEEVDDKSDASYFGTLRKSPRDHSQ